MNTCFELSQFTSFSSEELERFNRDGFIVVRSLAEANMVKQIVQVADKAIAQNTPPVEYEAELGYPGAPPSINAYGGQTPRRFKQALCRHPVLFDWAIHPKVLSRLHQILGPALVLPLAHHNCIMVKDSRFSSDTGWHRDIRYWRFQLPELIIVQLALTPATPENGCLRFLPGTHKISVKPEQLDDAEFLRTDLPENRTLLDKELSVPLEPGDVIFFHCMTFHAASRNRSRHAKKSVIFTYRSANNPPVPGTRSAAIPELLLPYPVQSYSKKAEGSLIKA